MGIRRYEKTKDQLLYKVLKDELCRKVFDGEYGDGDFLPTERKLSGDFKISRVTVRKTLDLMEKEGILSREQGRGTFFTPRSVGFNGKMEIVALVAKSNDAFFSSFIYYFERIADENDSLIVFRESYKDETLDKIVFKLYRKDVRDMVIWAFNQRIEYERFKRLRNLGCNMVFFDRIVEGGFADCVCVDNFDAISSLYKNLKSSKTAKIAYIGLDVKDASTVMERQNAFRTICDKDDMVFRISLEVNSEIGGLISYLRSNKKMPDAFLCENGYIGTVLKRKLAELNIEKIKVCHVDDLPESETQKITTYRQPLEEMSEMVYECLKMQNKKNKRWKAKNYYVKGKIIKRE